MKTNLVGGWHGQILLLAACLGLIVTDNALGGVTAVRPESPAGELSIPAYGDHTPWGRYFRQLQDTTATSWYEEITYYSHRYEFSRGAVTARFTVAPDGTFHNVTIISNTSNPSMADALIRAFRKTYRQPFPAEVAALAPNGLVFEQTFGYWEYDPTNYGLASSYPQLLTRLNPEVGGAFNLNLRKFFDLSRFRYQSRIIEMNPAGAGIASR